MTRLIALACLVGSGCFIESFTAGKSRSEAELGMNARRYTPPASSPVAFRTNDPAQPAQPSGTATTATLRFTQTFGAGYGGEEAEFGHLADSSSNVAGGYGLLGVRGASRIGGISAEIAGGWRTVRTSLDAPDISRLVAEPRVRGELWIANQVSLGAAVGASLGEQVWMAGLYIGVHSRHDGN